MELGQVVYSIAGRDEGGYYAVIDIVDENFVKIADGGLRRIKSPKLKKIKHLKTNGDVLEKVADKLKRGVTVFDAELASALRFYNDNKK